MLSVFDLSSGASLFGSPYQVTPEENMLLNTAP